MENKLALVATDLDGTLLRNDKSISVEDLKMLEHLGEQNILRVCRNREELPKSEGGDF